MRRILEEGSCDYQLSWLALSRDTNVFILPVFLSSCPKLYEMGPHIVSLYMKNTGGTHQFKFQEKYFWIDITSQWYQTWRTSCVSFAWATFLPNEGRVCMLKNKGAECARYLLFSPCWLYIFPHPAKLTCVYYINVFSCFLVSGWVWPKRIPG